VHFSCAYWKTAGNPAAFQYAPEAEGGTALRKIFLGKFDFDIDIGWMF